MRTATQALMWELWRLSRWELVFRIVAPSLFWCGIFALADTGQGGLIGVHGLAFIVLLLMIGASLFSGVWMSSLEDRKNGFPFHLGFTRPIGTVSLVAVPMVYIAGSSALCYLLPAALLRMLFGIPFPLLPVAVAVAAACAGFMMSAWSPRRFFARLTCYGFVVICYGALVIFVTKRPPEFLKSLFMALREWPEVKTTIISMPIGYYAAFFLFFIASIAATIYAVGRQRRGEEFLSGLNKLDFSGFISWIPQRDRPFKTASQAQFWFEFRRSGVSLLLISFGLAFVAFFGVCLMNMFGELKGRGTMLWISILSGSPTTLFVLGATWMLGLKRRQGTVSLSTFDATQAMDNSGLALIKLAALTASVSLSWLILAATAAVWITLWGDLSPLMEAGRDVGAVLAKIPAWSLPCIAMILTVHFVAAGAMVLAIGWMLPLRLKLFVTVFAVMMFYCLLVLWDGKHGWSLRFFWEAHAWILPIIFVAVTFWALRKSLGSGSLAKRHFIPSLCLWIAHVGAFFVLCFKAAPPNVSVPLIILVFGLGAMALPLASFALSPLALAAHRHR